MDKELEIAELETKFMTDIPAGSFGIISSIPFTGWKEPEPITKKDLDEFIKAYKNNPEMFKKDVPRW